MISSSTDHLENVTLSGSEGLPSPKFETLTALRSAQVSVAEQTSSERHGIFEIGTTNKASGRCVFSSLSIIVVER